MNIYQVRDKGSPLNIGRTLGGLYVTQPQVDLIMSLRERRDLSERELVEFAREECGVVVPFEGGVAVLKRLSRRDASDLIDGLRDDDFT